MTDLTPLHAPGLPGFRLRALAPARSCLLSIDVEDWFHSNFLSVAKLDSTHLPRRVTQGVMNLLEELANARARATFFVLGVVAEEHRWLVRQIAEAGHEIGCHSFEHTLLYEQSPRELHEALTRSRGVLGEQSGQKVLGFRAPSWSIIARNLWALDVIAEVGFRYDSSIFPAQNYLYGIDGVPDVPYELCTPNGATLVEVPPTTLKLGPKRVGVGGGVYLRLFPLFVQRYARKRAHRRGIPFMVYTHPREFDRAAWGYKLPLSFAERAIYGFGLHGGHRRLRALLKESAWEPLSSLVRADAAEPVANARTLGNDEAPAR